MVILATAYAARRYLLSGRALPSHLSGARTPVAPVPTLTWQVGIGNVWDVAASPQGLAVLWQDSGAQPGFYLSVLNDSGGVLSQIPLEQYDPVLASPAAGRNWLAAWLGGSPATVAVASASNLYLARQAAGNFTAAATPLPSAARLDAIVGVGQKALASMHEGDNEVLDTVASQQPLGSGASVFTFPEAVPLAFAVTSASTEATSAGDGIAAVSMYRSGSNPGSVAVLCDVGGRIRWQHDLPFAYKAWYAVAIAGSGQSLWATSDTLVSLSSQGQVLWQAPVAGVVRSVSALAMQGFVVQTAYGWPMADTLVTFFNPDGRTMWATKLPGAPLGIYGFSSTMQPAGKGTLAAVAVSTEAAYGLDGAGKQLWEIHLPTGKITWASLLPDEGVLLLDDGKSLYAYRLPGSH